MFGKQTKVRFAGNTHSVTAAAQRAGVVRCADCSTVTPTTVAVVAVRRHVARRASHAEIEGVGPLEDGAGAHRD